VGGEWLIKGIAGSGAEIPASYYDIYYDNVRAEVKSKKGVLSDTYYTEYERVIIGLSAIGKGTVVEGYDLAPYLDEFDKGYVWINGFNLGRYWKVGPQKSLYLPGCLLKEENEIVVLETLGMKKPEIKITDKHNLG
jgi:hypothetical protein